MLNVRCCDSAVARFRRAAAITVVVVGVALLSVALLSRLRPASRANAAVSSGSRAS
jgi:hypothetical protein